MTEQQQATESPEPVRCACCARVINERNPECSRPERWEYAMCRSCDSNLSPGGWGCD